MYQRENPMTIETPNTVSELLTKNQEPLSPETIWEEYKKLSMEDQEKFIWNCVNLQADFHKFVVNKMVEDKDSITESGGWVQDGTKWSIILNILDSMS